VLLIAAASLPAQEQDKDPTEPIKNLQFQSADVRSVVTFLADYGGVNVVVAPEVKGTVTIKLRGVMWRDALRIIGRTYGLAVVDEPEGYIRVLPADKYREEQAEATRHTAEQRQLIDLETQIVEISNSTSDDIVKAVQGLMTERGEAISDPRSNSIILQEVPSNINKVVQYIKELDKPSRQIKISAQLLEVSSNALEQLGVSWTVQGDYVTDSRSQTYHQEGEVRGARVADPVGVYAVDVLGPDWSAEALVQMLVSDGSGKIVAHPEITTLDNTTARIQMGAEVPIKQFDESGNVVIQYKDVGTILEVTPHITAENQILMHLKPERSTFEFDPSGVIINTNNAETHVIVENGQTAVIGGLTTQDELETETGVPILKDIPLLGFIFRYTSKRLDNRDLVIFVTPTIVDERLAAVQSTETPEP
jgi:type IV pilus secretin PilQ/predicted competence protein